MIGTTLSHYRILDELGRGGMGIVYKAEDTKLDRTVAIKVLPAAALSNEDDRARFYREAKAAAALNHPHIAAVYEIDEAVPEGSPSEDLRPFIAMEFIEGGTLEDRIKQGPLKLEEALRLGIQIAEALKAAHAKSIVHRDIKSANIMLTENGQAKVLDFGLAQTTASTKLTRMGSTLGTVAFMSPEQARGEEVDGRTDLYSLGAVLYEMVSGRAPFGGEYEQAVVYSILNAEPEPLTALRTGVPMELERITNKLLAKEANRRYQTGADLIVDLEAVPKSPSGVSTSSYSTISPAVAMPATSPTWQQRFFWGVVAAAVLTGLVIGVFGAGMTEAEEAVATLHRVEISLSGYDDVRFPRMSPDGKYLAFRAMDLDDREGLFLRDMSTGNIRHIDNSQAAGLWEYDFSPQGGHIAFSEGLNGGVFTVVVPNGIPERRTDFGRFAYWQDEDNIIANDDRRGGGGSIYNLDLSTNEMTPIPVHGSEMEEGYGFIVKTHVPGSDRAFGHQLARSTNAIVGGDFKVFTVDLSSGELEMTEPFVLNPEYVKGGFLTYQLRGDDGELVVRPIDERTGQFTGQPRTVLDEGVELNWSRYAVSPRGDLLYTSSQGLIGVEQTMWVVDMSNRSTEQIGLTLPVGAVPREPRFSSDENQIAFSGVGPSGSNIYLYDRREDLQHQLTFDDLSRGPLFTSDDSELFFSLLEDTTLHVVSLPTTPGSGAELKSVIENAIQAEISPDGKWMASVSLDPKKRDTILLLIDLETDLVVWADSSEDRVWSPSFSPDSRFVAFGTTIDQQSQYVIRPVSGSARYPLTSIQQADDKIRWLESGGYLYYEVDAGIGRIPVRTQPTFNILGDPELILPLGNRRGWDIGSDGNTIVVVTANVDVQETSLTESKIYWYQNWSDHLKREFGK